MKQTTPEKWGTVVHRGHGRWGFECAFCITGSMRAPDWARATSDKALTAHVVERHANEQPVRDILNPQKDFQNI